MNVVFWVTAASKVASLLGYNARSGNEINVLSYCIKLPPNLELLPYRQNNLLAQQLLMQTKRVGLIRIFTVKHIPIL